MPGGFSPPPAPRPSAVRGYAALNADYIAWLAKRVPPASAQTATQLYYSYASGKDNASGKTPGTAIKTHVEMGKRLGAYDVDRSITVTHLDYPPLGADPLRLDFNVVQNDLALRRILFQAPALTVKKSGTIGAVTTRVRSTGVPWQVTGAAFDSTDVGLRLLIPTGARAGTQSAVALNVSGTQARTSGWMLADYLNLSNTPITPQVGDPYQVLQAPGQLEVDYVRVRGQALAMQGTGLAFDFVRFKDYDFAVPLSGAFDRISHFHREAVNVVYANCRFTDPTPSQSRVFVFTGRPFDMAAYSAFGYQQCCIFTPTMLWRSMPANGDFIDGCLALGEIACDFGAQLAVTGETIIQGPGLGGATRLFAHEDGTLLLIEDCGVFDWANAGLQFRGGLIVERGATARLGDAFYGLQGLWGTSAAALTVGADITDRSKLVYESNQFFIKGAADPVGGGYRLAGRQVGAAYDITTGLNTENVATGWSNLGTTGKDNMHDWPHDAHIFKEFNIG